MPEFKQETERLQPSLLDRLTDDQPDSQRESKQRSVLSWPQLRQAVLRDLAWLLNTDNLHLDELEDYPQVERSVLRYGMPSLTGANAASVDAQELRRRIIHAIESFEPRIDPATLEVEVRTSGDTEGHHAISFDIKAQLWAEPVPLDLLLKTEIDLESGDVRLEEGKSS